MLLHCVQISIHRIWLETLMDLCQAEERLQTSLTLSTTDEPMDEDHPFLERLCENLAEAGSFYESSLIQLPVSL